VTKLLRRLKISEVSAVEAGAGEDCKILLMKRHGVMAKAIAALEKSVASIIGCDDDDATKRYALAETFAQFQTYLDREGNGGKPLGKGRLERVQRGYRQAFEKILTKQLDNMEISPLTGAAYNRTRPPSDDDVDDDVRDDDDDVAKARHHAASTTADLLVESGRFPHRTAALDHLLNSPHGNALLARLHKAEAHTGKETTPMTTSHNELVQDIVKQYGIVALAKSMVQDQKSYGLDEHQFTQLATEHAQRVYSNDRPDVSFSKLYQNEESVRRPALC